MEHAGDEIVSKNLPAERAERSWYVIVKDKTLVKVKMRKFLVSLFHVYLGRRRKVPRVQVGRENFRAARSLDDDDFLGIHNAVGDWGDEVGGIRAEMCSCRRRHLTSTNVSRENLGERESGRDGCNMQFKLMHPM